MSHQVLSSTGFSVVLQRAHGARDQFPEPLSRHSHSAPIKQIAKHLFFYAQPVTNSEMTAREFHSTFLDLTPNAPMSGAEVRSTEASAPLAG